MKASDMKDGAIISRAIQRYHDLVRADKGGISGRRLEATLREMNLVFGDRTICRVLRPFFLTRAEADRLGNDVVLLMRAFRKVLHALRTSVSLRSYLRLSAEEEAVLACDRQGIEPDQIARIDGFLVRDGAFKVIEYNAESPGGIAFGDKMVEAFLGLPVMRAFGKEFELSHHGGLASTLDQLRTAHHQRTGSKSDGLHIAVVDYKSAPTRREFELCAEYFSSHGCPSRVIEPGELRFQGGRLVAGDFVIDVVYKRALVKDFVREGGVEHPLVKAVAANAVTCASGFEVHLLYRKELFAFLWDDAIQARLDDEERAAVKRCVPWSRIVQDIETTIDGRPARLVDVIRSRRHDLVLKPTNEYGGKGVVLGWLADDHAWQRTLDEALREPYLVQERVTLGHEEFPVWEKDALHFEHFFADINPYIWGGTQTQGFGGRLARGELLNVTAGGGSAVPVFVIENA